MTSDGQPLGDVADLTDWSFRVHQPDAADLAVPFDTVQAVVGDRVVLAVPTQQIEFPRRQAPASP